MKKKNDSSIETKEDGPYVGSDIPHLKTSRGERVKITKTIVLCALPETKLLLI